jgi:hypothetical protein
MTKLEQSFDISRNPEDYVATDHLIQRIRERECLEADVVTEVIEEGSIVDADDDGITLRGDWLFSIFEVVVAPKEGKVVTGYEVEG